MKIGNVSPESHIRDILNDIDTYTVEWFDPDINALCINFKDVTGTLFLFNRSDMIFISQTESNWSFVVEKRKIKKSNETFFFVYNRGNNKLLGSF